MICLTRLTRRYVSTVVLAVCAVSVPAGAADDVERLPELTVRMREEGGRGLLAGAGDKTVLFLAGSPEEMGRSHGTLLKADVRRMAQSRLFLVAAGYTLKQDTWFFDTMASIRERTEPHTPPRFTVECDAMSAAAGISSRDGRNANVFPELFHCSGVAVRGTATKDGRVLHARVLDYMRDIGLQSLACVTVYQPTDRHTWMSLGYAAFIGTVTACNDQGLAISEMGGGGEGQWDGVPMSYLLRDVMERAGSVEEALGILRNSPRTCEYYYVLSDGTGAMAGVYCTPNVFDVLRPGQQDDRLPHVPPDTIMFSAGSRAEALSKRLTARHGHIDVPALIGIIKRPVAMNSNLHNAIFRPETLDMWCADAGKHTVACDEPYVRLNLPALLQFHRSQTGDQP